MTDTPAPSAPAAPAGPLRALDVRLPVLRRPPGWGVLDEPALRVRATQLYLACMQQVGQQGVGGPVGPLGLAGAPAGTAAGGAAWLQPTAVPDDEGTTPFASAAAPLKTALAPADTPAAPPIRKGSHWHLLPWVLLLGGAMLMTPWLIWAPLVGGLCMGLLLLQTGMLRHWLQMRTPPEEAATGTAGRMASGFDQPGGLVDEAGIQAVQAVGPRRLRFAHGGWMLTAALVLVGVQAAMLITTLQLKSREPSAVAGAIRAAQQGRDTRQGTPPGPLQAREPLREGPAALTATPRPEQGSTGTTGPRPGGTP